MSTIILKEGDYIRDPIYHEWRYAMVTRDVEIDTDAQLFAKIHAVWVDEYLIGRDVEVSFSIIAPNELDLQPIEKKHVLHWLNVILDEGYEKVSFLAKGGVIIPFDPENVE